MPYMTQESPKASVFCSYVCLLTTLSKLDLSIFLQFAKNF